MHVDWALTGINRAVIDQRIKNESLFDLVRDVLLPRPVTTQFLYPSYGGFGTFCDKLAATVGEGGADLRLGTTVAAIRSQGDRIEEVELTDGTHHRPSDLIWSGNLIALAGLLGKEPPGVRYLSTVIYNMEVDADVKQHQQWIYYGGQDTQISRVSVTKEMAPYMSPPGKTGLCVEVTCFEGDRLWQEPETLVSQIQSDLVRLELVGSIDDFAEAHVERIRDTYPIYDLGYKESFAAASTDGEAFSQSQALGTHRRLLVQQFGSLDEDVVGHGTTCFKRRPHGGKRSSF